MIENQVAEVRQKLIVLSKLNWQGTPRNKPIQIAWTTRATNYSLPLPSPSDR